MATEAQINAVVDAVVTAFGGDAAKYQAFLTRAALETELAEIESEQRNKQAEADTSASGFVSELSALAVEKAAKIAEIDAL